MRASTLLPHTYKDFLNAIPPDDGKPKSKKQPVFELHFGAANYKSPSDNTFKIEDVVNPSLDAKHYGFFYNDGL